MRFARGIVQITHSKKEGGSFWKSFFGAIIGVSISAGVTFYGIHKLDNRERITGRIEAKPTIVSHLQSNPANSLAPVLHVVNEGPVAAVSLVIAVEMGIAFEGAGVSSNKIGVVQGTSRAFNRPWLLLTNSLPGGGAIEIPLGGATTDKANELFFYRVEVRCWPEFNFEHPQTNVFYFGKYENYYYDEAQIVLRTPLFKTIFQRFEQARDSFTRFPATQVTNELPIPLPSDFRLAP